MCGIFGLACRVAPHKDKVRTMTEILFGLSESRGKEASGLAIGTSTSITLLKCPVAASKLVKSGTYRDAFKRTWAEDEEQHTARRVALIGHSRLVTNGFEDQNVNNQPVVKCGAVGVHNGIVVNDSRLWQDLPSIRREGKVDTEVVLALLQQSLRETGSLLAATRQVYTRIEGSASVAVLFDDRPDLLLATNTGSLYVCWNALRDMLVFASEGYILREFATRSRRYGSFMPQDVRQLSAGTGMRVDTGTFEHEEFRLAEGSAAHTASAGARAQVPIIDLSDEARGKWIPRRNPAALESTLCPEVREAMWETWRRLYSRETLRRCTKCILPETLPFIDFDEQGVCTYCRGYKPQALKGPDALERLVSPYRRSDGRPDCVFPFSGGRDSVYGLHYVKNVLHMNPIAYTYDWGVLTDLGRRNQARICGKLGVEHVIVSADIRWKRENIRKNLTAWLRKPELGMIPLLMAGDKQLIYHADVLRERTGTKLLIYSAGGGYEDDAFKVGLTGVRMQEGIPLSNLPLRARLQLGGYYARQHVYNPAYINSSLWDSLQAFYCVFFLMRTHDIARLYEYIQWDEEEILSTIMREYDWETEPDTVATWRIDDGTAAFYNYVYMTVAGFTEFDTFRSVQIRKGQMTRDKAYDLIRNESKPRFDSIEWYARTIGFDCNDAIRRVNAIPKHYSV